ncbi:MAG: hypothetical protein V8T31_08090 [Lachnospiraceae bacterium]
MAQKKKRPTAKERRNGFIINVLTLIVLILLVFEGKSLISLFSSQTIQERIKSEESEVFAGANLTEAQSEIQTEAGSEKQTDASSAQSEAFTEAQTDAVVTDLATGLPNDDASYLDVVVPAQETPVDDLVSKMQSSSVIPVRRASATCPALPKAALLQTVGLELENFYTDDQIATANGNVKSGCFEESEFFQDLYDAGYQLTGRL